MTYIILYYSSARNYNYLTVFIPSILSIPIFLSMLLNSEFVSIKSNSKMLTHFLANYEGASTSTNNLRTFSPVLAHFYCICSLKILSLIFEFFRLQMDMIDGASSVVPTNVIISLLLFTKESFA